MMTKYQLVFVKIESAFQKIAHSHKLKERILAQDAFYMVKRFSIYRNADLNHKTHAIYLRFRDKHVCSLINLYNKKQSKLKHLALSQWWKYAIVP